MVFRVAHISDLMNPGLLDKMLEQGYITRQNHPWLDLKIYNYARKTQFERMWNPATLQCRGLILDNYGQVVARPFPKFFNLGEMSEDDFPDEPFEVFDKMDGSLGILYPDSTQSCGYAIATRGSFASEQADWASKWLARFMTSSSWTLDEFAPAPSLTYLFEIVYPENRIVVDYGGSRTLILLDVIENATGRSTLADVQDGCYARTNRWPGNIVRGYTNLRTLEQVTTAEDPGNAEGFVIKWRSGVRAKFKFDEYVRLHRILTNVSTKTVWEWLAEGKDITTLLESTPDEFDNWVNETARELTSAAAHISNTVYGEYQDILERLGGRPEARRDFAREALKSDHSPALFAIFDDQYPSDYFWAAVKPQFSKPFTNDKDS